MKITHHFQTMQQGFCSIVDQRPWTAFLLFASFHFALWTLLPWLLFSNPFMDVIEGLVYGREWQIGYDKHPPLAWWLLDLSYRAFHTDKSSYLLSQLSILISLAIVFAAARDVVPNLTAFASILILDGLHYFHFTGVKFNQDVLQLPIWALAGYAYWRALKDDALRWWLLLAFALAAAFWCKYFAVVLAIPLAAFVVADPTARRRLAGPNPYLAFALFIILTLPHLIWLWRNDFVPLDYASVRSAQNLGALGHLIFPAQFLAWQAWYLLPCFAIATALFLQRSSPGASKLVPFDQRVLTLLALGPAVTLFCMSLISGRVILPMWGYPLWLFMGLYVVVIARSGVDCRVFLRVTLVWALCFAGFAVAFVLNNTLLLTYKRDQRLQTLFPGQQLAQEITSRYSNITGAPPAYVIGSIWVGGNASHFSPGKPKLLVDALPFRAPWIDPTDVKRKGAVIVWTGPNSDDGLGHATSALPPQVERFAGKVQVQKPFTLNYHRGNGVAEVAWAIMKPE